jgi:hypothetical protein
MLAPTQMILNHSRSRARITQALERLRQSSHR